MEPIHQEAVTQIALVVDDIDAYLDRYAKVFRIERPSWFLTDTRDKSHTLYKGEPTDARAKLAFIRARNITIELIEPVGKPSVWADFLERNGPGVHHIAFQVADRETAAAELGLETVQTGDYTGGCYAYLDGTAALGLDLELLQSKP